MKGVQRHIITLLHLSLIAAMLSTSFLATRGFFNDTITSKQYGLEIICLSAGLLFVITFAFKNQLLFTKIDLLVILFATWYLVNELFSDGNYTQMNQILFALLLWGLVYMFIRQLSDNTPFIWGVSIIWMLVVLLQSGLGLMQLYGFSTSHHALFDITGTFHNSGPFSGFVASVLPIALSIIAFPALVRDASKTITPSHPVLLAVFIRALAWTTLIAAALVLPPTQSRAAWIAGTVGCLFVLTGHPAIKSTRNNLKRKLLSFTRPMQALSMLATLLVVLIAGFGLYAMKKGSADGRVLIWQVTSQLIKQKPIAGHGSGAFAALYINEQAKWFEAGNECMGKRRGSSQAPQLTLPLPAPFQKERR